MEDVKVVNSFCDVTYDFGIHFALLNVRCTLGKGQLISEENFGVFKSPKAKILTKFCEDFCTIF